MICVRLVIEAVIDDEGGKSTSFHRWQKGFDNRFDTCDPSPLDTAILARKIHGQN